jgi:hypothetical protein
MLVEPVQDVHADEVDPGSAAIHKQMERLLASSFFAHSLRVSSFLRFVVEQSTAGHTDQLKERTLGMEVFRRDADYDTASDSIVRVTAAELRKRIAQYYSQAGHESELRISLLPGSYVPQFHWPDQPRENDAPIPAALPTTVAAPAENVRAPQVVRSERSRSRLFVVFALLVGVLAGAGATLYWRSIPHPSSLDEFWAPVLSTDEPLLFCVSDQNQNLALTLHDANDPTHEITTSSNLRTMVIDDIAPILRVADRLRSRGKKYSIKGEGVTDLTDLRNGPTVFIGAFDNSWTLWITKGLRYHFANNPDMTKLGIVDSTHPDLIRWVVDRRQEVDTNNRRDFAIVARFSDATTGKPAVVIAGVSLGGTMAAGEFLTSSGDLDQIMRNAGSHKNVEIVLSTQIVDGEPGSPKVEAVYFW